MEWRDEGILLWVRRHGESNAIIEALTAERGRYAGLVRGGASKSVAAIMQPGAQLSLEWSARLAEHLGTYKTDLIKSRAATIMVDRAALAALNAISALLVQFLPEREPNENIYTATLDLVDALGDENPYWPMLYAHWELTLLEVLGFGLDLNSCASTGTTEDLAYVSPRSGRAVCRSAGGPFADRMLPLPPFLIERVRPTIGDVREALRTTGFFLEKWVCPAFDVAELPRARNRLIGLAEEIVMEPPPPDEVDELTDDERDWLSSIDDAPEGEQTPTTASP